MIDKTKIHNILFITLSNIGDVVLTLPVLGVLKREFPEAKFTVMVSPRAKEIFQNDPAISKIISYDKHISLFEKLRLGLRLRKKNFDLVVDLRSTLYPLLINAAYRTKLLNKMQKARVHKRYAHLSKLKSLGINIEDASYKLLFNDDNKRNMDTLLKQLNMSQEDKIIAVAPGAKSHTKQWQVSGFARLCQKLNKELGLKVLLVGTSDDKETISQVLSAGLNDTYDISARTSIYELAYLLSKCRLLITNDSAPMHIADIVDIASVAIFGPTDYIKYRPMKSDSIVIRKDLNCSPCERAQCEFNLECMKGVTVDEVFEAVKGLLRYSVQAQ
ncbi:MAG: glycosyltransferase family 9 protein [Candidatus Omnitrophota bacterium]